MWWGFFPDGEWGGMGNGKKDGDGGGECKIRPAPLSFQCNYPFVKTGRVGSRLVASINNHTRRRLCAAPTLEHLLDQLCNIRESPAMEVALCLFFTSLLFASASAQVPKNVTANPADELMAVLNANRTAHKSSTLYDNPGLACIALQYIKAYQGKCNDVGGPDAKKPADSEFAETFAPTCGIEVSTLSQITGRLLGCQSKYVHASEAFSEVLMRSNKSLDVLYNKNHTEAGAAVVGTDGGSPYFWCVLFSSGKTNSSFAFEGGVAKTTRPGCFSGANDICSDAADWSFNSHVWPYATTALIALSYALGL